MAGNEMFRKYEVTIIFNPDLDDAGLDDQLEKVDALVKAHSGSIESKDVWGRRPLGYPIKKREHGIYVLMIISADNGFVHDLRRQLKINDQVLRHLCVSKDRFAPDFVARTRETTRGGQFAGGRRGANDGASSSAGSKDGENAAEQA